VIILCLISGLMPIKNNVRSIINPLDTTSRIEYINEGSNSIESSNTVGVSIFLISDWHGWIQPHEDNGVEYGGAATLMGHFIEEGYDYDNDSFLILSAGDHNTGPAEATLSKGAAIIDVMNAMNFSAAVIGNHEFDFGYDVMEMQKERANFPLLGCNIFDEGTTDIASFSTPYVIQEHAGIKIGIIGLALNHMYAEVEHDYDFGDYEESLRSAYTEVMSDGADIVIVLAHVIPSTLRDLASSVDDLEIELFMGGHAHVSDFSYVGDSLIVATEPHCKQYAKVVLHVDKTAKSIVAKEGGLVWNNLGGANPVASVQEVVDYWVNEIDASEVISYTSSNIYDGVPESAIGNLVTDAIFNRFGRKKNFAVASRGGSYRDYFREGDITLGDIVSVVPFENNLLKVKINGTEILKMLYDQHGSYTYSGIRYRFYYDIDLVIHSVRIFEKDGFYTISPEETYIGYMLDFNWWQDYYGSFSPEDTGVNYRDAVVEYFKTLDDLSLYTYDDRILDTDVELEDVFRTTFISFILVSVSISLVPIILNLRKKKGIV
jgi:2',3'-cyclic-nucleotide 2'-phosphodiesterase (5'-nucleotidase family)